MKGRPAVALAVAVLTAVGIATGAAARSKPVDFHNARYCEVFELRGTVPDAKVLVWNTIGLSDCPQAKWDAIDPDAIAAERGDTAVVLNGPRHFLMDSATGDIGTRVRTFGGLRMRRVATIPIDSASDLAQTPYTDREITRSNTWTWDAGRRVYELLAPNGRDYVMQSYALIRDPQQTIGSLKKLGKRLDLPQGWSYRTRRLKHDLTLKANGAATIVQDDLLNTYQRLPRKRKRTEHEVDVTGSTKTVGAPSPGTLEDAGTISGPPFGNGTVDILVKFEGPSSVTGTFTTESAKGSAFGTLAMQYAVTGNEIDFNGTATFTGGTGKLRGITGTVDAHDHNTLDGQSGVVELMGTVRY